MRENVDYELIISDQEDFWDVRILTGDYIETVFNFGAIQVSEDTESLKYSTEIKDHQFDDDYDFDEDLNWHNTTGKILLDILERSLENENTNNGASR